MLSMAFGGHSSANYSASFFDLIKSIGESASKQEQDRIITAERNRLKSELKGPSRSNSKECKEWVLRALYCEMLGIDASFAFIQGINLAQDNHNLIAKRTGYLFCGLSFVPKSDANLLLVNTLLKDLESSHWLFNIAALVAICSLPSPEISSEVADSVVQLTNHRESSVRKRAFLALQTLMRVSPQPLPPVLDVVSQALSDSDAIVMSAALPLIEVLVEDDETVRWKWNTADDTSPVTSHADTATLSNDKTKYRPTVTLLDDSDDANDGPEMVLPGSSHFATSEKSLLGEGPHDDNRSNDDQMSDEAPLPDSIDGIMNVNPTSPLQPMEEKPSVTSTVTETCLGTDLIDFFVALLEKVAIQRELRRCHYYYRIPAPWIQTRVFAILERLGQRFPGRADSIRNLFVRILDLMIENHMMQNIGSALVYGLCRSLCALGDCQRIVEIAGIVDQFINSTSPELRYAGLKLLTDLTLIDASYAKTHAIKVVEFLEDKDEEIRKAALRLVAEITTSTNIDFVTDRIVSTIAASYDRPYRSALCQMAFHLLELYASEPWEYFSRSVEVAIACGDDLDETLPTELLRAVLDASTSTGVEEGRQLLNRCVNEALTQFKKYATYWLERGTSGSTALLHFFILIIGEFSSKCSKTDIPQDTAHVLQTFVSQHHDLLTTLPTTRLMLTFTLARIDPESRSPSHPELTTIAKSLQSMDLSRLRFDKVNMTDGPAYRPLRSDRAISTWDEDKEVRASQLEAHQRASPIIDLNPTMMGKLHSVYPNRAIQTGISLLGDRPIERGVSSSVNPNQTLPGLNKLQHGRWGGPGASPDTGAIATAGRVPSNAPASLSATQKARAEADAEKKAAVALRIQKEREAKEAIAKQLFG